MTLKLNVLAESSRVHEGVEYTTITGMEVSDKPLLQMVDYGLREEEKLVHKGKLMGKSVLLQVESIRAIFGGRPQLVGRLVENGSASTTK